MPINENSATQMVSPAKAAETEPRRHWAGHGHIGAFLFQVTMLILVKLGIWFFVFLMALRLLGEPMPWE